jgi:hypothetical protein
MKKLLTLSIFSILGFGIFAQREIRITTIKGEDTTTINLDEQLGKLDSIIELTMLKMMDDSTMSNINRKFELLIDTVYISKDVTIEPMDTTKIRLGGKKILIIEDKIGSSNGNRKIIIDEDITQKNGKSKENDDDKAEENDFAHWAGFGIMANGFLNSSGKISSATDAEFLELDYARSIGANFNLLEKRFPIFKEYIGLTTGLGIQWNRYMLKNNVDVFSNQDSTFGVANGFIDYRKNVLRATYIQAPLLLEFNTNKNPEKAWHLSVGVVGGIRIGSSLKTKWSEDDKTRKERVKSNFNFNPFQAYATAIVGYHNVNLYVNYGLTEIFEKGKGPAFSPVNAGVLFNF